MRVTILGSGTAIPDADRFPAGVLVRTATTTVCVDLGPGTLRRLAATGVELTDLDAVLLTHYHTDHCADVAALLFALRNPLLERSRPLRLIGGPGLHQLLDGLEHAWPWTRLPDGALLTDERTGGHLSVGDLNVTAVPVVHTAASLAYRLEGPDGTTAAVSGDVAGCEGIVEVAGDVQLFVCDSATPDEQGLDGHLTPGSAGAYAARASVESLCLTHFYPPCEGVDLVAQARRTFDGPIHVARDLLTFELTPDAPARPA